MTKCSKAFNEWMRRYTVDPEQFEREWQSVVDFLSETSDGKEPSYGEACEAYLLTLIKEVA